MSLPTSVGVFSGYKIGSAPAKRPNLLGQTDLKMIADVPPTIENGVEAEDGVISPASSEASTEEASDEITG